MFSFRLASCVLAVVTTCAGAAQAQERSASAAWTDDGHLKLSLDSFGSNGCYSKGPSETGAPADATPIVNAVSVSFHLEHAGADFCAMGLVPISWQITLEKVHSGVATAIIYEVDGGPRGGVQGYAVAIPDRP